MTQQQYKTEFYKEVTHHCIKNHLILLWKLKRALSHNNYELALDIIHHMSSK